MLHFNLMRPPTYMFSVLDRNVAMFNTLQATENQLLPVYERTPYITQSYTVKYIYNIIILRNVIPVVRVEII
jgi:hypothetical protein